MKRFIITFFILLNSLFVFCQNWQGFQAGDTSYFTSTSSIQDTFNDGYLKCIWIDSISTINADSVFHFNKAIDYQQNNGCHLPNGPSWLGSEFIKKANGNELYFNNNNDTIFINNQAQLNDSWVLLKDSNNLSYVATISNIDTITVNGVLDSSKEITIQVYNGAILLNHFYTNKKFVISKSNGFVNIVSLLFFPYTTYYNELANFTSFMTDQPWSYSKVDSSLQTLNFASTNLLKKYQPGNEWILKHHEYHVGYGDTYTITHDSVLQSSLINASQIIFSVNKKIRSYGNRIIPPVPPSTLPSSVPFDTTIVSFVVDTFYQTTKIDKFNSSFCSETQNNYQIAQNKIPITFVTSYSDFPVVQHFAAKYNEGVYNSNCFGTTISVSGVSWNFYANVSELRFKETQSGVINWQGYEESNGYDSILYFKIGASIYGTKINVNNLSLPKFANSDFDISVNPVPCKDFLFFNSKKNSEIKSIYFYDISGNKINAKFNNNKIETQSLPSGFYIIEFSTVVGKAYKKFSKMD
jgi:hypothetical protein